MINTLIGKVFGTKNERMVKGLMPRVVAINALEPEVQKLTDSANDRFALNRPMPINERDTAAKIREDPLLAIKRREQEAVKAIMNNPLKMRELQESKSGKKKKKEQHRLE